MAPFVAYYNRVRNSDYLFDRRLDATGPTPQPEAAYRDSRTSELLVVELKSLIWPSDFGQLHRTSHEISDIIQTELTTALDPQRAYRLTMRDDLRGSRNSLRAYAISVARAIKKRIDRVHAGTPLFANWPNREWRFREEAPSERDFTEPSAGLVLVFNVRPSELDYGEISEELVIEWKRLTASAAKKLVPYAAAKRILVVDPYADMRWSTDKTWKSLIGAASIPVTIDEIWMSMHAMITEVNCGWVHKQLWPMTSDDHYEFCHDPEAANE